MTIHTAIRNLKSILPLSVEDAQQFLDTLSPDVQKQLISAIYLGREHIHSSVLRDDIEISTSFTDSIKQDEYARILHEKELNSATYLDKLEMCAKASNFDLEKI